MKVIHTSISFSFHLILRFNVTQLEEWLRSLKICDGKIKETLEPLVHASQLLQLKKQTDADALEICEMCTKLNPAQVCVLNLMILVILVF